MIGNILRERSAWEDITKNFNLPDHNGTIDNLRWFVDNGYQTNRLRKKYKQAQSIAAHIIELVENERTNWTR
jgi:hypothetical protein